DVVVVANQNFPRAVLIYYQTQAGVLDAPVILQTPDFLISHVAVGDLNQDGKADLVVSGELIRGSGEFLVFYQDPASGALLPPQEHTVSGLSGNDIRIADINSDGRNDVIVLVNNFPSVLSIFYQREDGSLGPENIYGGAKGFILSQVLI